MANRRYPRLITPIVLGAITTLLTITMLVGWILVIVYSDTATWLLVLGIISISSILLIETALVIILIRGIRDARRQQTFLDGFTHELKSPISSAKLALETLARPDLPPNEASGLRAMIAADIERLSAFVDDILAVANQQDAPGLTYEEIDVETMAERCVTRACIRHQADRAGIDLQVDKSLLIQTDPVAFETILGNLIDNAVKYSNTPLQVQAIVTRTKGAISIAVRDWGIGLSPRERRRIFKRFYRVDDEQVRSRPGTGLGLFVVADRVRALGGKITAHSAGHGHGTTMRVVLPDQI